MNGIVDCLAWKKEYRFGGRMDSRVEELANQFVCEGQCFPCDWDSLSECVMSQVAEDMFILNYSFKEGVRAGKFAIECALKDIENYDFRVVFQEDGRAVIVDDSKSNVSLDDQPVLVCLNDGPWQGSLREAKEKFGVKEEGNPDDVRRFARCPRLVGLCGPMSPNEGFIARYESWEVYDMLSR